MAHLATAQEAAQFRSDVKPTWCTGCGDWSCGAWNTGAAERCWKCGAQMGVGYVSAVAAGPVRAGDFVARVYESAIPVSVAMLRAMLEECEDVKDEREREDDRLFAEHNPFARPRKRAPWNPRRPSPLLAVINRRFPK